MLLWLKRGDFRSFLVLTSINNITIYGNTVSSGRCTCASCRPGRNPARNDGRGELSPGYVPELERLTTKMIHFSAKKNIRLGGSMFVTVADCG